MGKHTVTYSDGYHIRRTLLPGQFILREDFAVTWDGSAGLIRFTVEAGFKTDLASIPVIFRRFIPKMGKWNQAAICHDWAYCGKTTLTKAEADLLFLDAMRAANVVWWRRRAMYLAVRVGGNWRQARG